MFSSEKKTRNPAAYMQALVNERYFMINSSYCVQVGGKSILKVIISGQEFFCQNWSREAEQL